MAYLLSGLGAWNEQAPRERRATNALEALRAAVAYLREDHRAQISDEDGRPVSLGQVLAMARDQAGALAAGRRLTTALADYVEAVRDRDVERVRGRYELLTGPGYEREMLMAESTDASTAEQRRHDAEERHRLRDYLHDDGSWREVGVAWARDFGQPPPPNVVEEVLRRHPDARCDDLRLGAEEWLNRTEMRPESYQALPTADGFWGVWSKDAGEFERTYVFESIAQAHVDALNAQRPWSDRDFKREMQVAVDLIARRSERHEQSDSAVQRLRTQRRAARRRWARASTSSPPPPSSVNQRGSVRTRGSKK